MTGRIGAARIGALRYGTTPTWGTWSPGAAEEQALEVASEVATTDAGRAVVADLIRLYDRDLAPIGGLVGAAVWVPSPATGDVRAFMHAAVLRGDPTTPSVDAYERETRHPPRRRGAPVLDRSVERVTLPVGPAIVEIEIRARRPSRRLECEVAWMVFPDGYLDTVLLSARTPSPEVLDALLRESELMVGSLEIDALETDLRGADPRGADPFGADPLGTGRCGR